MSRPRLLDLFCGAGGCVMGYHGCNIPDCRRRGGDGNRHLLSGRGDAMGVVAAAGSVKWTPGKWLRVVRGDPSAWPAFLDWMEETGHPWHAGAVWVYSMRMTPQRTGIDGLWKKKGWMWNRVSRWHPVRKGGDRITDEWWEVSALMARYKRSRKQGIGARCGYPTYEAAVLDLMRVATMMLGKDVAEKGGGS